MTDLCVHKAETERYTTFSSGIPHSQAPGDRFYE